MEDASIIANHECIVREAVEDQPMIDDLSSPHILLPQYDGADSPGFIPGIHFLATKYLMRRVRGDGNCFYRAFLFSYLEELLIKHNNSDPTISGAAEVERARMAALIHNSLNELVSLGYSEMTIETFFDMFEDLLANLFTQSRESLLTAFQEGGEADYFTWFMRLLTAGALLRNSERFLPFVEDALTFDMATYVKREVEPMGKECEQVQILALAEYLGVTVRIEYLDGRPFDQDKGLSVIVCPEEGGGGGGGGGGSVVSLLYRPGHYDILYPQL